MSRRRWLALIAAVALVCGFAIIADEMLEGGTLAFDNTILLALRSGDAGSAPIGPAWFQEAARDVTALGSFAILFPLVAVIAGYLLIDGKPRIAWALVVSSLSGAALSTLLKMSFERPRPDVAAAARVFTSSFPSGHALTSALIYLTIGAFLARAADKRRLGFYAIAVAAFLTVIVGASRVYLGVHYPSDVLAGWMIGISWAIFCWLAADVLFPRKQAR